MFAFLLVRNVQLNEEAKRFITKAYNFLLLDSVVGWMTGTFFILRALEYLSFNELGFLLAIQFSIQLVTDYPTGAIGDWIGQKWVYGSSLVFFSLGFFIFSIADSFILFLIVFILLGFASAQISGAWNAWYDNNFKLYAPEDDERQIYSLIVGKSNSLFLACQGAAIILGGFLAVTIGRSTMFLIHALSDGSLFFVVLKYMQDHPNIQRVKPNIREYFHLLGKGISYSVQHKYFRIILIGTMITNVGITIWSNFLLFPFYESYTKTDDMIGLFRASLFFSGAFFAWIAASVSKRLNQEKACNLYAIFSVTSIPIFFWLIMSLYFVIPPTDTFQLLPLIILEIVWIINHFGYSLVLILIQRIYLDIIPDENRNSIYSLLPTITAFISIPVMFFGGVAIDLISFAEVTFLIGLLGLIGGFISGLAIFRYGQKELKIKL